MVIMSDVIQEVCNRLRDPDKTLYVDWSGGVINPNLNGRARAAFLASLDAIISASIVQYQKLQSLKANGIPLSKYNEMMAQISADYTMSSEYSGLITSVIEPIKTDSRLYSTYDSLISGMRVKVLDVTKASINFTATHASNYVTDFELKQIIPQMFSNNQLDYARATEIFWGFGENTEESASVAGDNIVFYNLVADKIYLINFKVCRELDMIDTGAGAATTFTPITIAGITVLTGSSAYLNTANFPVGSKIKIKFATSSVNSGVFTVTASTAGTVTYSNPNGTTLSATALGTGGYIYSGYYPTLDMRPYFHETLLNRAIELAVNQLKKENIADSQDMQTV